MSVSLVVSCVPPRALLDRAGMATRMVKLSPAMAVSNGWKTFDVRCRNYFTKTISHDGGVSCGNYFTIFFDLRFLI